MHINYRLNSSFFHRMLFRTRYGALNSTREMLWWIHEDYACASHSLGTLKPSWYFGSVYLCAEMNKTVREAAILSIIGAFDLRAVPQNDPLILAKYGLFCLASALQYLQVVVICTNREEILSKNITNIRQGAELRSLHLGRNGAGGNLVCKFFTAVCT